MKWINFILSIYTLTAIIVSVYRHPQTFADIILGVGFALNAIAFYLLNSKKQ